MSSYDVRTKSMLIHPRVETVVRLSVFAKMNGITKTSAASRLLESHPDLSSIELDEDGVKEAEEMVKKNIEERRLQKYARAFVRRGMESRG